MSEKVLKTVSRNDKENFFDCCYEFAKLTKNSPEAIAFALVQGIQQFDLIEGENGKLNVQTKLYDKNADFYPNACETKETENG